MSNVLLLLLSIFVVVNSITNRGSISFLSYSSTITESIAGANGGVTVSGNAVKLLQSYEPRVYLMNPSGSTFYRFPNLLGKTIQFTMDLSQSTCSCNAAFYLVQFPSTASVDSYCDAQGTTAATRCTELDILEANTQAFQTTVHCNAGTQPCQWGCGTNWKIANGYGPGGSVIDTKSPFTVAISFVASGSTLQDVNVKLSQSGRSMVSSLQDSSCTWIGVNNYISALSSAVASGELVLAISYWSGNMNWLDGCSSGGSTCPTSSVVTFSGIELISSVTVSPLTEDSSAITDNGFVDSDGFYAVIGVGVLVVLVVVVALMVLYKKKQHNAEVV